MSCQRRKYAGDGGGDRPGREARGRFRSLSGKLRSSPPTWLPSERLEGLPTSQITPSEHSISTGTFTRTKFPRFFSLPSEIRIEIYQWAAGFGKESSSSQSIALLATSTRVFKEAQPFFIHPRQLTYDHLHDFRLLRNLVLIQRMAWVTHKEKVGFAEHFSRHLAQHGVKPQDHLLMQVVLACLFHTKCSQIILR